MNLLISRYILEIEKDCKLFKLFNNGSWYPNFDKYRSFIHKQEKNNNSFAKAINRYHLIKNNDNLFETVGSKELDSVSSFLSKKSTIIESGYGIIKCSNSVPNTFDYPTCYISNGIYHDTENIALHMVNLGSFIVGVCDNPNSIFYQQNMDRIEEFRKVLDKKKVKYKIYRHNNHRDKTFILYYRSDSL